MCSENMSKSGLDENIQCQAVIIKLKTFIVLNLKKWTLEVQQIRFLNQNFGSPLAKQGWQLSKICCIRHIFSYNSLKTIFIYISHYKRDLTKLNF